MPSDARSNLLRADANAANEELEEATEKRAELDESIANGNFLVRNVAQLRANHYDSKIKKLFLQSNSIYTLSHQEIYYFHNMLERVWKLQLL